MQTLQRPESGDEAARESRDSLDDRIRRQVVGTLGKPGDLLTIQVRPVGSERYRVNVVVGKDVGTSRIANSYFVTTDAAGTILTSLPKIVPQYGTAPTSPGKRSEGG